MATRQEIQLDNKFRFIHEPLGASVLNEWHRFIGRQTELDELAVRILLSAGGAFLVTGYRGVGKTTFVNRVVRRLEERIPQLSTHLGPTEIVSVYMNFARPMKPAELMFHILRGLRLQLAEKGLLHKLEPKVRDELELAFMRTSVSLAYKASEQAERSFELGDLGVKIPYLNAGPKLKIGSKRTKGMSREYSYLAYDDKAAEYDLIQITRQLSKGYRPEQRFWRKLITSRAQPSGGTRLKMLFIFDELDKIEEAADGNGKSAVDEILASLKNVFTTSGISFIFVAGRDTYERWLEDLGRGDSVYESIFTYARYLPTLWTHVDQICDGLLFDPSLRESGAADIVSTYSAFKKFLAFKGRGIPRRIIRGFNNYVCWDEDKPCLRFEREDVRQFTFYAKLYEVLTENEEQLFGSYHDSEAQLDQQRLSVYYLIDWILQKGLTEFTTGEVVAASRRLSRLIAPAEQVAPEMVRLLIKVLLEHEYIEDVKASQLAQEIGIGAAPVDALQRYKIVGRRLAEMGKLTGIFDQEAKAILDKQPPGVPVDRYQVLRHIGHGGMSNVYEAIDRATGRKVAIKQMLPELCQDESFRARFAREAQILAGLQSRNIVGVYDVGLAPDQMYIAMEFIEGVRLTDLIRQNRTRELSRFLTIAKDLLHAVQAIHERGISWGDPKPGNIMITPEGRLVLLDFGLSRLATDPSGTQDSPNLIFGTPAYVSPEAVLGKPLDARSDLYGIGVILFEMLAGRPPFQSSAQVQTAFKQVSEEPPPLSTFADVPAEIEHVVLKCLAKNPADRFQSAAEILAALPETAAATPQVNQVASVGNAAKEALQDFIVNTAREDEKTVFWKSDAPAAAPSSASHTPVTPLPVYPPPSSQQPAAPQLKDCLTLEGGLTPAYYLTERNTLGRSANNDIVLNDPDASRYHALIAKTDLGFTVEDLNTANGTYVNHERLSDSRLLKNGDRIQVGKTTLTYHGPVT